MMDITGITPTPKADDEPVSSWPEMLFEMRNLSLNVIYKKENKNNNVYLLSLKRKARLYRYHKN